MLIDYPRPTSGIWDFDAQANTLHIEGLQAGLIDLTGLSLRRDRRRPNTDETRDHVFADSLVVHRDLTLFIAHNGLFRSAHIPGSLRLNRASIGTLTVTADSFSNDKSKEPEVDGVVLREATIGQFRVLRCRADSSGSNGFPVPLDLTDARIARWDFVRPNDFEGRIVDTSPASDFFLATAYLDLLDNDQTFSRNLYRRLVKSLRNDGRLNAALRLHHAEHYRAFWEPRGNWSKGQGRMRAPISTWWELAWTTPWYRFGPWTIDLITAPVRFVGRLVRHPTDAMAMLIEQGNRRLLRYGASPMPLLLLISTLAMISFVLVAADPRNFELTDASRQLIATQDRRTMNGITGPKINLARDTRPCDDGEVVGPDPAKWNLLDGLWVTVRYHVPIIGVFARDDIVPTNDRKIILAVTRVAQLLGTRSSGQGGFWTQVADDFVACPTLGRFTLTEHRAADQIWPTKGIGISPEDWFQAMAVLNWIMWPILITALIRRLVVRED